MQLGADGQLAELVLDPVRDLLEDLAAPVAQRVSFDHHHRRLDAHGPDGDPRHHVQQVHAHPAALRLRDGVRESTLHILVPDSEQDLGRLRLEHVDSFVTVPRGAVVTPPCGTSATSSSPLLPISAPPEHGNRDLGPAAGGPSARAASEVRRDIER